MNLLTVLTMRCIVGLGNIGKQYERTRHNIGFMTVDYIASQYNCQWKGGHRFKGDCCQYTDDNEDEVILLKPHTYMNASGSAVAACAQYYKIKIEDIFVVHDELELPLGKLHIKQNGSHRGHNGLRSINSTLGNLYNKISIGIGRPSNDAAVADYVLGSFTASEMQIVEELRQYIFHNLCMITSKDVQQWAQVISGYRHTEN